jgi:hypothetical protein
LGEYSPTHTREFVCERNDRDVSMRARLELVDPHTQSVTLAISVQYHGASAMNEQTTQIGVATFGDAQ